MTQLRPTSPTTQHAPTQDPETTARQADVPPSATAGRTPQQPAGPVAGGSQAPQVATFSTANDLPAATRGPVIRRLNQALADATDLVTQAKFAHWNVKGINFYQLHRLFDDLHEVLEDHADMIAERATALGGQAMGTARLAAATSSIPELSPDLVTGQQYLEALAAHLAIHATNLREDIAFAAQQGDADTADLFTELSREVDKQLYFLESHLQTHATGTVPATGPE